MMAKKQTAGERFFSRAVKLLQFETRAESMSPEMQAVVQGLIETVDAACESILQEYAQALEATEAKDKREVKS